MGILGIIWRNFGRRARTRRPDDMPPRPTAFRGLIEQDPSLCTGCKTCAYVCSPKAISFAEEDVTRITWNFFAGQCAFCGLCVQFCPTGAITNLGKLPPVTGEQSELKVAHEVRFHPCTSCGKPIIPIPEEALEQVYGGALSDLQVEQRTHCEACRRKSASRRLFNIFARP
jgi:hydrogenase-4 component H